MSLRWWEMQAKESGMEEWVIYDPSLPGTPVQSTTKGKCGWGCHMHMSRCSVYVLDDWGGELVRHTDNSSLPNVRNPIQEPPVI